VNTTTSCDEVTFIFGTNKHKGLKQLHNLNWLINDSVAVADTAKYFNRNLYSVSRNISLHNILPPLEMYKTYPINIITNKFHKCLISATTFNYRKKPKLKVLQIILYHVPKKSGGANWRLKTDVKFTKINLNTRKQYE
jgi:hypothetical protein